MTGNMEPFLERHRKDNFLVRVDARVKLLSGLLLLILVLSHKGFAFPLLVALLCLSLCLSVRVPARVFIMRFSSPMFIALMVVVLKFFFTGENAVFSIRVLGVGIEGHMDGLMEGLLIACRISASVSIVATVGFVTPFTELTAGMSWLRAPRGFIEILVLAYGSIFLLLEEAMVIYNAQKNRLGYSNLRRGLKSFGTLSGALMLRVFENGERMAASMAQRGYDGNMPIPGHKKFKLSEVVASAIFMTVMATIWKM